MLLGQQLSRNFCLSREARLPWESLAQIVCVVELSLCHRRVFDLQTSSFWAVLALSENISQHTAELLAWNTGSFSSNIAFQFWHCMWKLIFQCPLQILMAKI